MTAFPGQSSAGEDNKEWPPEVAARLRTAMIWFVVVMLLSMVLTIAYVAGRTWSVAASAVPSKRVADKTFTRPESPPAAPVPRPTEAVLPITKTVRLPIVEVQTRAAPAAAIVPAASIPIAAQQDGADGTAETPVAGLYLQVAATDWATAEKMEQSIRSLGLRGRRAPGPSDRIFRVLVGPFESESAIVEALQTLEANGYHPFARRYR
jgi:hypothetical protein